MAERYLDVIHPSPEQLHQWSYDDLYMTSQDEDLLRNSSQTRRRDAGSD